VAEQTVFIDGQTDFYGEPHRDTKVATADGWQNVLREYRRIDPDAARFETARAVKADAGWRVRMKTGRQPLARSHNPTARPAANGRGGSSGAMCCCFQPACPDRLDNTAPGGSSAACASRA
jgi:hypothetical protein